MCRLAPHKQITKMKLDSLSQMVGRTIRSVTEDDTNVPALVIAFTDDSTITLEGGGYEGCGDYLRVREEPVPRNGPPPVPSPIDAMLSENAYNIAPQLYDSLVRQEPTFTKKWV